MKFFEFIIKQKLVINMFAIFFVTIGIFSFLSAPKETFPQIKMGLIVISTIYPNASPLEVEKLVTTPYEDAIKNLTGIKKMTSASSESNSMIVVHLEAEVKNIDKMVNDIQTAIDKITDIPEEVVDPMVFEISMDMIPAIQMAVAGGNDYGELRETVKRIDEKVLKIDGVGGTQKWGMLGKTIWVNADPAKLSSYALTVFDIVNTLKDSNMSASAGNMVVDKFENGVRFSAELEGAQDVKEVIIRSNETGKNLKIQDVAKVVDGFKEDDLVIRSNGKKAILFTALKGKNKDTIKVVKEVRKTIEEMKKNGMIKPDISVSYSYDMSLRLKERLRLVYDGGVAGAVLVLIVLLLLLRPSIAIWTALGLPVSFAISLLVMQFFGVSFNMLSMFGYIMVLGMLVDNNIVIGENVYRYIQEGKKIHDAVVIGATEVIMPVFASVLTSIASFAPFLLISGMMGEFLRPIPIVISLALIASLIESFLILPTHLNEFVKVKKDENTGSKQEHWFEGLRAKYSALLTKVLYKRKLFIVGIVALFIVSIPLGFFRGVSFVDGQVEQITINLKTPNTNSTVENEVIVSKIEDKLMPLLKTNIDSIQSYVGYQDRMDGPPVFATNRSQVNLIMKLQNERKTKDSKKLVKEIRDAVGTPEGVEDMKIEEQKGGMPTGREIDIVVSGDTYGTIIMVADELQKEVKSIKGAKDVSTDLEQGKREIKLVVDSEKAARAKVSNASIAGVLRSSVSGLKAKSIKKDGEDIEVMVRLDKKGLKTIEDLLSIRVPNMYGQRIVLSEIVRVEGGMSYTILNHRDAKKAITVFGAVDKTASNVKAVNDEIMKKLKELEKKYPYVEFTAGGEYKEMQEGFADLFKVFIVAFLLIFIIIAALFNSLIQPLVIMAAIPFGFIGVMLALFLHWMPVSFGAFMGFIALSGVIVNNSILMTDFFNHLVRKGVDVEKSLVEAASIRLRPIVLTTVTTVISLIPMGYSFFGTPDPFLQPVAIAFSWGLIFGTIVTLFLVPCLLVFVHNITITLKKKSNKNMEITDKYLFVKK